jgi:hypothetical protein
MPPLDQAPTPMEARDSFENRLAIGMYASLLGSFALDGVTIHLLDAGDYLAAGIAGAGAVVTYLSSLHIIRNFRTIVDRHTGQQG